MRPLAMILLTPFVFGADPGPRPLDPSIPQIAYWFWWPEAARGDDHLRQAALIVDTSPFNLLVYTKRDRNLADAPTLPDQLRAVADLGRPAGVRLVVQRWQWPVPRENRLEAVIGRRLALSASGAGRSVPLPPGRVMAASVARVGLDNRFDPARAVTVPADQVMVVGDGDAVRVEVGSDPARAGYVLFFLWAVPVLPDVFDDATAKALTAGLSERFGGVGLAGLVTDEQRSLDAFDSLLYSPALAQRYRERFSRSLKADLLLATAGSEGARIGALRRLLWARRRAAAAFEEVVAGASRQVCGADAFTGLHATFASFRPDDPRVADEFARNALCFWDLDRTYSQTDEDHPLPLRLGQARHCTGPVWFNMVYGPRDTFERQIVDGILYGGRIHYHAVGDPGTWGVNVDSPAFLAMTRRAEGRIRLLNAVQRALPRTDLLVLWGYPGSVGWLPERNPEARTYPATFRLAKALWDRGYLCDVVPTYEIDDGEVALDTDNRIRYHDATYDAVLWTTPAFAGKKTLSMLARYTAGGGRLLIAGACTTDGDGDDASAPFNDLVRRAAHHWPDVPSAEEADAALAAAGVPKRRSDAHCTMLDGLVIAADRESLFRNIPWKGAVRAGDRDVTFDARGLFAVAFNADGALDRLAAGGLTSAAVDGNPLVAIDGRADVAMWRDGERTAVLARNDDGRVPAVTDCAFRGVPAVEVTTAVDRGSPMKAVVTITNHGPQALDPMTVSCRPRAGWAVTRDGPGPDRLDSGGTVRVSFSLTARSADAGGRGLRVVPVIRATAGRVDLQIEPEVYTAPAVEIELPTNRAPVTLDPKHPTDVSVTLRNPDRTEPRRGSLALAVPLDGWRCTPANQVVEVPPQKTWTGAFRLEPTAKRALIAEDDIVRLRAVFTPEDGAPIECRSAAVRVVGADASTDRPVPWWPVVLIALIAAGLAATLILMRRAKRRAAVNT